MEFGHLRSYLQALFIAALGAVPAACVPHGESMPIADRALVDLEADPPQPDRFAYCFDYGCSTRKIIGLSTEEWAEIIAPLHPPAPDPEAERFQIAHSVGRFEQVVGSKLGTSNDKAGTLTGYGRFGQLDCVDEAVNTTRFLIMIEGQGLLHHHQVGSPVHRAWISWEFTHMTATVRAPDGATYAMDTWFKDNGGDADVIPIGPWLDGWKPKDW